MSKSKPISSGSKSKSIVLIDGSNFYFKLKSLGLINQLAFNYHDFAKFIVGKSELLSATYYVGKVRADATKKSQKLHKNQQRLLAQLRKHGYSYKLGYLLKTDGSYHEKGVDVQLAVDLLAAAYENVVDRIILISSDTDLIPAIRKAQSMGKIVEHIGFHHQKSIALATECKKSRRLMLADLQPFIG